MTAPQRDDVAVAWSDLAYYVMPLAQAEFDRQHSEYISGKTSGTGRLITLHTLKDALERVNAVLDAPPAPAGLCSVCSDPAQPGLTLNLLPVCTNCVRTSKAHNKEKA